MAIEVVSPQMFEKFIFVDKPGITKFTIRVTFVRFVVLIAFSTMSREILSCVVTSFMSENLENQLELSLKLKDMKIISTNFLENFSF